jgi:hypothetical protein
MATARQAAFSIGPPPPCSARVPGIEIASAGETLTDYDTTWLPLWFDRKGVMGYELMNEAYMSDVA